MTEEEIILHEQDKEKEADTTIQLKAHTRDALRYLAKLKGKTYDDLLREKFSEEFEKAARIKEMAEEI